MGRNVVNQQFTFISYIINKYFTFPVFSLINIYGMFVWLFAILFTKNRLDYNYDLRSITMNFPKEMAYTAHMFVIGLIFSVSAPVTNIIIFVTYWMFAAIDRYFILYVNMPTPEADLSSQANMMLNVIMTIFLGLAFMLFGTCCYFIVQSGPIYTFGIIVCVLCFAGALFFKLTIDRQFKRALRELARGKFSNVEQLIINPAHVHDDYDEKTRYKTVYDMANAADVAALNKKLKRTSRTGRYKMSFMDKILKRYFIDLAHLPVSYIRIDDMRMSERVCAVLNEDAIKI